jgi:hypothetical protein
VTADAAATTAERLTRAGLRVPDGHSIWTMAERPEVEPEIDAAMAAVWPQFMREHEGAAELFGHADRDFPDFQFVLLDPSGRLAAVANSMPLVWDGTDDGLPDGWLEQGRRGVADHAAGRAPNALGAMQIVVRPGLQGGGLSGTMIATMRAAAKAAGFRAVMACLRPTWKHRYPLAPIARYAWWTRADGQPLDPWIRLHVRLGARLVKASPHSMTMRGSVADWERWTGLELPESGAYVIPNATAILTIDRERGEGVSEDENVWVVHDLG